MLSWCPLIFQLISKLPYISSHLSNVQNQCYCFFTLLLLQTFAYILFLLINIDHQYLQLDLELLKLRTTSLGRPIIFMNIVKPANDSYLSKWLTNDRKLVKTIFVSCLINFSIILLLYVDLRTRAYANSFNSLNGAFFYVLFYVGEKFCDSENFDRHFYDMIGSDGVREIVELKMLAQLAATGKQHVIFTSLKIFDEMWITLRNEFCNFQVRLWQVNH